MIQEDNTLSSGVELTHPKGALYPASVLLLTIPMAMLISNSFPAAALPALATGNNEFNFGGPDFVWAQLAVVVSAVIVFYEIGKRIDFAGNYRMLAPRVRRGAPGESARLLPLHCQFLRIHVGRRFRLCQELRLSRAEFHRRPPHVRRRSVHDPTGRVGACILQVPARSGYRYACEFRHAGRASPASSILRSLLRRRASGGSGRRPRVQGRGPAADPTDTGARHW